ncbi:uncharacterized protein DFL_000721 [Arthrobotrys flagrans]|uniref:Apple domain-containing protein n=1 Tax=Arthrobotrys flagrans TaxID=97331 RepID=A0A437AF70_ARTFL|nr:hypothetical protein DFL_000721 [Arthrobotrys flagrans]
MRSSKILIGFIGLCGSANATACNADNCLRAVRATLKLPQASADCSSFLRSTFTPGIRTVTEYSTISELAEDIYFATQTSTVRETLTSVIKETATTEIPGTIKTETSYDLALKKRQAAPTIPAYASPCSGPVRYTSACSCIGVTGPIVVTAPTPSTTLTLPTTITYSTETIVTTILTTSVTITDATVTLRTTDSTATITGPPTTVTITVPYPDNCKSPTLYNGLRPLNFAPLGIFDAGDIAYPECCLRCFTRLDCIAYVRSGGTCLLLSANEDPNTPNSPMCPNGIKKTIFGNPPGSVGKGPCQETA